MFGIKIPTDLHMITDFMLSTLFKRLNNSSRATVNRIAAVLKEAAKAEDVEVVWTMFIGLLFIIYE